VAVLQLTSLLSVISAVTAAADDVVSGFSMYNCTHIATHTYTHTITAAVQYSVH